jgi:protein-tyrosine phosphatase
MNTYFDSAFGALQKTSASLTAKLDDLQKSGRDLANEAIVNMKNLDNMQESEGKSPEQVMKEPAWIKVTPQVYLMGFPPPRELELLAQILQVRHRGRFRIVNLSGKSYDYARFDDAVVEVQFPGMSAPFLGLLCKLCMDQAQFMQEHNQNILIIHCTTGKGRTATVASCLLAFSGCYSSPFTALQVVTTAIGNARGVQSSKILLASQRRYVHYFQHILNGIRPQPQVLTLRRVVVNLADADLQWQPVNISCVVNKAVVLRTSDYTQEKSAASFAVDCYLQGDVLFSCKMAKVDGEAKTIRGAFHGALMTDPFLRIAKAGLDGAAFLPAEFSIDFHYDIVPCADLTDPPAINEHDQYLLRNDRFWDRVSTRAGEMGSAEDAAPESGANDYSIFDADDEQEVRNGSGKREWETGVQWW